MQFNSPEYLFFFIIVFFVFWFLLRNNIKLQNIFLLAANYIFYTWWDWRFLFLIIFISWVNYYFAIQIRKIDPDDPGQKRKLFLIFSIVINLTLLGIFKYFNFFAESAVYLLNIIGFSADTVTLNVVLPIGISFYTFQTMSYTIDVYRTKVEPTKDIIAFFTYVSFFPLILAGPIERAGNLLVQFFKKREFNYDEGADGMRLILWGLFKKLVVADRVAIYVNAVYNNADRHSGTSFILATFFFAFQIYCDFSAYSDIAIGSAKLLGFKLTANFNRPYFSRDIAGFWRRWHISLSTWLRDYLFLPLNLQLRNLKTCGIIISIIATFLICGLWHGADWTFIVWGILHGSYLAMNFITTKFNFTLSKFLLKERFISIQTGCKIIFTFMLICFSWVFFRANNVDDAINIIIKMINLSGPLYIPKDDDIIIPVFSLFAVAMLVLVEFKTEFFKEKFSFLNNKYIIVRFSAYLLIILIILLAGVFDGGQFIYFQF